MTGDGRERGTPKRLKNEPGQVHGGRGLPRDFDDSLRASWLNQVEIYFSILQHKALTPNDFPSLDALEERLHGFARCYETIAKPFEWKFARTDLDSLLDRIDRARAREQTPLAQAA